MLKEKLRTDLSVAMKARDEVRTRTLRMALTALTNEEVAGKQARELSDDEVVKVLQREAKKRREAAEAFADAGRTEQAEAERAEGVILDEYLPAAAVRRGADRAGRRRHRRDGRRGAAGDGPGHEGA